MARRYVSFMQPPSADDREGRATLQLGSLQWAFSTTQQGGGCSDYFDRVVMPPPPSIVVASSSTGASNHFTTPPLPCTECPACHTENTFFKRYNPRYEDHRYDGHITEAWCALTCGACGRWLATYELGGGTEWEKRKLQLYDGSQREW